MVRGVTLLLTSAAIVLLSFGSSVGQSPPPSPPKTVPTNAQQCNGLLANLLDDGMYRNLDMKDVVTSDEYQQVFQLCKAGQYQAAYNLVVAVMGAPKGAPPVPTGPCEARDNVGGWYVNASDETYSASHDVPMTYTVTRKPFINEPVPAGCTPEGICEESGNGSIAITGKPGVVTPVYLYFPREMALPDSVDYLLLVDGKERNRGTLTIDQSLHRADASQLIAGIFDIDEAVVKVSAGGKDVSQFALSLKGRSQANSAASELNDKLGSKKRSGACYAQGGFFH